VVPGYRERVQWHHKLIAEALEEVLRFVRFKGQRGGIARLAISMPPRHGKTLHGTELFPAMGLGVDPDLKFICASNGADLARDNLANAVQWIDSDAYKSVFPTRIGKVEQLDDEGRVESKLETTKAAQMIRTLMPERPGSRKYVKSRGYYIAQGIGGSIVGKGGDVLLLDDPIKNGEQALSDNYHRKLWTWYASTFTTRKNHQWAAEVFIGTRWTEPDFIDELVGYWQSQSSPARPLPIKVIRLAALAEDPLEDNDPRQVGEPLDTIIHSRESYEAERAGLLATEPWVWFAQWQSRPRMAGLKFFQPNEWMYYGESFDIGAAIDYIDFSVDTNLAESGESYACIHVFGVISQFRSVDGVARYFLLDESRGHYDLDTIEFELVRLGNKWRTAFPNQFSQGKWWVENKALGPTIVKKYAGDFPMIVPVPKIKGKLYCYRAASTITGQQRLWIPKESFGVDPTDDTRPLVSHVFVGSMKEKGSWVQELGSYPSKPDDRRDTLAMEIICRTPWFGIDMLGRA
jgi:hypothetical protein